MKRDISKPKRKNIMKTREEKEKCFNKDDSEIQDENEEFLFLKARFPGYDEVIICLNYSDAKMMEQEKYAPYVPNGFTPTQKREIARFINEYEHRREQESIVRYDADLSNLRHRPRTNIKIKDEIEASKEQFKVIKNSRFETTSSDKNFKIQKGIYLHSPDEDTPAYIDYETGEQRFYNEGRLTKRILPDGSRKYHSQKTGRTLDFPPNAI